MISLQGLWQAALSKKLKTHLKEDITK